MKTATKATHTPGPWIFNGRAIEQDVPRDALAVAYCESEQNDDWEANARLIAAAPQLLAACRAAALTYRALERNREILHDVLRQAGLPSSWIGQELEKAEKVKAAMALCD